MFLSSTVPITAPSVPFWLALPFICLLLLIAIAPLFFGSFWSKNYKVISVILGISTAIFYLFLSGNFENVEKTLFDFFSFMCLLYALYVVAGGICIETDYKGTPAANVVLLLTGAVLTNFIGTTGAAILLIRPFIRLNKERMKPYLIVFFIFLVCNIGGILTPLGPPLILGFIKGVPFEWMLQNVFTEWLFTIGILFLLFYIIDSRNKSAKHSNSQTPASIKITGTHNFFWLILIIGSVFLNPDQMEGLPTFRGHSFIRELLQIIIAILCLKTSSRYALQQNHFRLEPIKEVGFLFFGIFLTMIPALDLLANKVGELKGTLSPSLFYWGSGVSSAFLDNAPAYLSFLTTAMSVFGFSVNVPAEVALFSQQEETIMYVKAITLGASFFGAMTYIGNGPNFIIKAMCENEKIEIPSFFGYIFKYAIPLLLPVLILVWLLFIF